MHANQWTYFFMSTHTRQPAMKKCRRTARQSVHVYLHISMHNNLDQNTLQTSAISLWFPFGANMAEHAHCFRQEFLNILNLGNAFVCSKSHRKQSFWRNSKHRSWLNWWLIESKVAWKRGFRRLCWLFHRKQCVPELKQAGNEPEKGER